MKNKNTQRWLFGISIGLMVVVTMSSFSFDKYSLYKGGDLFDKKEIQTSVLNDFSQRTQFSLDVKKVQPKKIVETPKEKPVEKPTKVVIEKPNTAIESSNGCKTDEIPVLRGGEISSCRKRTCEDDGKSTYLGEDKPGLLYGMCITK